MSTFSASNATMAVYIMCKSMFNINLHHMYKPGYVVNRAHATRRLRCTPSSTAQVRAPPFAIWLEVASGEERPPHACECGSKCRLPKPSPANPCPRRSEMRGWRGPCESLQNHKVLEGFPSPNFFCGSRGGHASAGR